MATVVIETPGWREKVKVAGFPFLNNAARDIAQDIRDNLVEAGNVKTGELLDSVRHEGNVVTIGTDHWHYIEYGTEPHVIEAKFKRSLANVETGQMFGKRVFHPGNREFAPIRRAVMKKREISRY